MANLMNYETGSFIREATADETAASLRAAELDGGVGAITVEIDGEATTCYVIGENEAAGATSPPPARGTPRGRRTHGFRGRTESSRRFDSTRKPAGAVRRSDCAANCRRRGTRSRRSMPGSRQPSGPGSMRY